MLLKLRLHNLPTLGAYKCSNEANFLERTSAMCIKIRNVNSFLSKFEAIVGRNVRFRFFFKKVLGCWLVIYCQEWVGRVEAENSGCHS